MFYRQEDMTSSSRTQVLAIKDENGFVNFPNDLQVDLAAVSVSAVYIDCQHLPDISRYAPLISPRLASVAPLGIPSSVCMTWLLHMTQLSSKREEIPSRNHSSWQRKQWATL